MLTLARRYTFCAAHRLAVPGWEAGRNETAFGPCGRPEGHGHNYVLWVSVEGPVSPQTGRIVDPPEFDRRVRRAVLDALDHRDLNGLLAAAGIPVATSENLCRWIAEALEEWPAGLRLKRLELWETEKNGFEWTSRRLSADCSVEKKKGEG